MTLAELAKALNIQFKGAPEYEIHGLSDIETLSPDKGLMENRVYFVESPAVLKKHPQAALVGAVLTTPALAGRFAQALIAPEGKTRLAFIALLRLYDRSPKFPSRIFKEAFVHSTAKVSASASILPGAVVMQNAAVGDGAVVYPGAVLEPFAELGEGSVLYPNAVLGHHCRIGKHCIVHAGTVIGADGFGFFDDASGRHKIPQIGNAVIGDFVEIGASCTVDRATIESTTIGDYTKLDDQVHVGHNCRLGKYIYIVGNTAVGGSVVIEDGAMLSGMVIVKDHVKIAAGSIVMGLSGVAQDTEPKTAYFGAPARPARQMHKMHAALERLPELLTKVRELEVKIKKLEAVAV